MSGGRTPPLPSLLPSRSRQGSVGSDRRLHQAHRGKMPNMSDGRHMPTVSNNCDMCVWCFDGSCDFCEDSGALQQGLGPGPVIKHHQILVDGVDIDPPSPVYYDVLISAITNALDIHSLVLMMNGACSMSISFRCKCSPSMQQITFKCKSKASDPQVPPAVLVQWFMAKMSVKHIECHIWKLAPNVDLLQNHLFP
jgi:hypothetical protein